MDWCDGTERTLTPTFKWVAVLFHTSGLKYGFEISYYVFQDFFFSPFRPLQGYEACTAETSLWSCCGIVHFLCNNHAAGHVHRIVRSTGCVAVMDSITAQFKDCVPAVEVI
jgi:hypothetical protein